MGDETTTSTTTTTPADGATTTAITAHALPQAELEAARELILSSRPKVQPELLSGSTIAELRASADAAEAIYQRIADDAIKAAGGAKAAEGSGGPATAAGTPAVEAAPAVPAGTATAVDPSTLPTTELIKRGLAQRRAAAQP